MDKQKILTLFKTEEDRLLASRIIDFYNLSKKHNKPCFTNFLSLHEQEVAKTVISGIGAENFEFFGGVEGAERKLLCFSGGYVKDIDFPVSYCVLKSKKGFSGQTHRNFLGSVMGLGITREKIGDIIICEKEAVIILHNDVLNYIKSNLTSIGRLTVSCDIFDEYEFSVPEKEFSEILGTVASLRLDAVVALCISKPRNTSQELIISGSVTVNFTECKNLNREVKTDDIISIRKFGRFKVDEIGGLTKKGRRFVKILKYI